MAFNGSFPGMTSKGNYKVKLLSLVGVEMKEGGADM